MIFKILIHLCYSFICVVRDLRVSSGESAEGTFWGADNMSQLERNLKILGVTMLVGALFDWAIAALVFFRPGQVATFLGMSISGDLMTFRLCGLLLAILPLFYIMAFIDTKRNVAIVAATIVGRVGLGVFFVVHVLFLAAPRPWLAVGLINLGFAAVHLIFFKLSDFDFWPILCRAGNPPL
jgi:hypothetical protein